MVLVRLRVALGGQHYGKKIKVYHYIPLLDDRNVNDQGIDAAGVAIDPGSGNLYGSSKDIGTITGKLPTLTENGGRVNRVGFTRVQLEGEMYKFGFFHEFTQESLDFDSDEELFSHLSREMVTGAVQLTEAVLQKDLLAAAGVTVYAGAATDDDEITGEGGTVSEADYADLMRLNRIRADGRNAIALQHSCIVWLLPSWGPWVSILMLSKTRHREEPNA